MLNLNKDKKKLFDIIIMLPFIWAFTGLFLYPSGKKLIVILVLLSAITSTLSYGLKSIWTNITTNKLLWLLGAYSVFALMAKSYYGYSSSLMRALIAIFVLFATFPTALVPKVNIKLLIVIGSVTCLTYVLLETYIFHHGRAWSINPIPYATFIASLSILAFHFLLESKTLKSATLWLSVFIVAAIPLLYSQSRGLWLALLIMMTILIIKQCFSGKKKSYLIVPFLLASAIAYHFSEDKIMQRIEQTKQEIQHIEKGELNTSIGLRLQMWKTAVILAQESPLIGLGDKHIIRKKLLAKQKLISPKIVNFTHYHNQFLSDLVKYGIVGFMLLLMSILLPSYYLLKRRSNYTWPGMLIISIFVIASLTDMPFQHAQTLTIYFFFLYIFTSQSHNLNQEAQ